MDTDGLNSSSRTTNSIELPFNSTVGNSLSTSNNEIKAGMIFGMGNTSFEQGAGVKIDDSRSSSFISF